MHPSLRDYLRENVAPAEVWRAIQTALEGNSESARISASRLLVDALHTPHDEQDWREQMKSQMKTAAQEFDRRIELQASAARDKRRRQLDELLELVGLAELADHDEMVVARELLGRLQAVQSEMAA